MTTLIPDKLLFTLTTLILNQNFNPKIPNQTVKSILNNPNFVITKFHNQENLPFIFCLLHDKTKLDFLIEQGFDLNYQYSIDNNPFKHHQPLIVTDKKFNLLYYFLEHFYTPHFKIAKNVSQFKGVFADWKWITLKKLLLNYPELALQTRNNNPNPFVQDRVFSLLFPKLSHRPMDELLDVFNKSKKIKEYIKNNPQEQRRMISLMMFKYVLNNDPQNIEQNLSLLTQLLDTPKNTPLQFPFCLSLLKDYNYNVNPLDLKTDLLNQRLFPIAFLLNKKAITYTQTDIPIIQNFIFDSIHELLFKPACLNKQEFLYNLIQSEKILNNINGTLDYFNADILTQSFYKKINNLIQQRISQTVLTNILNNSTFAEAYLEPVAKYEEYFQRIPISQMINYLQQAIVKNNLYLTEKLNPNLSLSHKSLPHKSLKIL